MQLSLLSLHNPLPVPPASPTKYTATADEASAGIQAVHPLESKAVSFEECFSPNLLELAGGQKQPGSELEHAAETLAASYWMPTAPTDLLVPADSLPAAGVSASATESVWNPVPDQPSAGPVPGKLHGQNSAHLAAMKLSEAPAQVRAGPSLAESPLDKWVAPLGNNPPPELPAAIDADATFATHGFVAPAPRRAALAAPAEAGAAVALTESTARLAANPPLNLPAPLKPGVPGGGTAVAREPVAAEDSWRMNVPTAGTPGVPALGNESAPELALRAGSLGIGVPAPGRSIVPVPEKIAAQSVPVVAVKAKADFAEQKEFLNASHKPVAAAVSRLGTPIAQWDQSMSSAPSNRPKAIPVVPAALPVLEGSSFIARLTMEAPLPVASLRETMAAVAQAIATLEQRTANQPQRVDLQLNVGSESLTLRVELKDGTLHTIFQTVSAELRSALSREWDLMVPSATSSQLRFAEPVFHATPGGWGDGTFGSTGQGALPQRGQPSAEPLPVSRFIPSGEAKQSESTPAANILAPSLTLLNAFA